MRRFSAMVAMLGLIPLLAATPSFAAVCDDSTKQHIFAHDVGNGTVGGLTAFSGVAVTTLIRDDTLDPNCVYPYAGRWTTAHMSNPNPPGGLVEIGWATNWAELNVRQFWIFVEVIQGGIQTDGDIRYISQPSTLSRFKVERNPSITNYWKFFYDLENDQTYIQLGDSIGYDGGFSFGWAKGETGRRGSTSAYDDLSNLWSRRNPGVWMAWTNVIKDYDTISSYHCHRVSANRYQVHSPNTDHSCT